MPSPTCPICAAPGLPCFEAAIYRMYQCEQCASAFVSPMPTENELRAFYSNYHQDDLSGGRYDAVEERMDADFPAKVSKVLRYAPPKSRLLDVGCGKGYFLDVCTLRGIDAWGIDLSDTAIASAKLRHPDRVYAGNLRDLKDELGTFDVITLWATIEHLPNPRSMILDMVSLLRPGGHVILDTGIAFDWLERLLASRTQWYTPPEHLFVFSFAGLKKLLTDCGLQIVNADPNWERNAYRKFAKNLRNGVFAAGVRLLSTALRIRHPRIPFTRYPIGNLQSIVARNRL